MIGGRANGEMVLDAPRHECEGPWREYEEPYREYEEPCRECEDEPYREGDDEPYREGDDRGDSSSSSPAKVMLTTRWRGRLSPAPILMIVWMLWMGVEDDS